MEQAEVFTQHTCAKFFSALELELFDSMKWAGLTFYSKSHNRAGTVLPLGGIRNVPRCLISSLLFLHNVRNNNTAVHTDQRVRCCITIEFTVQAGLTQNLAYFTKPSTWHSSDISTSKRDVTTVCRAIYHSYWHEHVSILISNSVPHRLLIQMDLNSVNVRLVRPVGKGEGTGKNDALMESNWD